ANIADFAWKPAPRMGNYSRSTGKYSRSLFRERSGTASSRAVRAPRRLARPLPHRGRPAMLLVVPNTTSATALLSWELKDKVNRAVFRRVALIGAMVATVAAVAGVAYWDAARESAKALQEFAQEQGTL